MERVYRKRVSGPSPGPPSPPKGWHPAPDTNRGPGPTGPGPLAPPATEPWRTLRFLRSRQILLVPGVIGPVAPGLSQPGISSGAGFRGDPAHLGLLSGRQTGQDFPGDRDDGVPSFG